MADLRRVNDGADPVRLLQLARSDNAGGNVGFGQLIHAAHVHRGQHRSGETGRHDRAQPLRRHADTQDSAPEPGADLQHGHILRAAMRPAPTAMTWASPSRRAPDFPTFTCGESPTT